MEKNMPGLRHLVLQYMMHPIDHLNPDKYSRCNKDKIGKCQYNYPHPIRLETTVDEFGRPLYRRRHTEDSMVVPYCPLILTQWQGHVNFEVAFTVNSFLYLYKYVYKGPDMTQFRINTPDEPRDPIDDFVQGRYITCHEAAFRLLGFDISRREPTVIRLAVHEPGCYEDPTS
jgi:hypothetical protein